MKNNTQEHTGKRKDVSQEQLNPNDFTVEIPKVDDVEELVAMHGQSWLDTYPNDEHGVSRAFIEEAVAGRSTPENLEKRRQRTQEAHDSPETYFLRVAKDTQGGIIGYVDGRKHADYQEFGGLYVDKTYHGTGVAQLLTKQLFEWLDESKPTALEVASYNARAIAFYRKLGFEEVPGSQRLHREVIPVIKMQREAGR